MNKLSKEKRDKLIGTSLGFLAGLAVIYFLIISGQRTRLSELAKKKEDLEDKVSRAERFKKAAPVVAANLEDARKAINQKHVDMAPPPNFNYWLFKKLESYERTHEFHVTDITEPQVVDAGMMLPKLPYQAAIFTVVAQAHYHDLGRFVADFENTFPYMKVQQVTLHADSKNAGESQSGAVNQPQSRARTNVTETAEISEKLSIVMKVVALIKPTAPL